MSYQEAKEAIRLFENETAFFDYDKSVQYATKVKEFVRRSRRYCELHGISLGSPFVDTLSSVGDIPTQLFDSILSIARQREWSPQCVTACREYLRFVLYKDKLSQAEQDIANIYEPLYSLLVDGGDFYEHHGDICVRDAATIVLRAD